MPKLTILQETLNKQMHNTELVLTPSTSPVQAISRFIASLPMQEICWPFPDIYIKGDRLFVEGKVKDNSWPIKGIRGQGIDVTNVQMIFTEGVDDSYDAQLVVSGKIKGGKTAIQVQGKLRNDNRILLGMVHDQIAQQPALADIAALAGADHAAIQNYQHIQKGTFFHKGVPIGAMKITNFQLSFGYGDAAAPEVLIEAVPVDSSLEIIAKKVVLGSVVVRFRATFVPRLSKLVFKAVMEGRLSIDWQTFPVRIPLSRDSHWECHILPDGNMLPSLLDLAQWIDEGTAARLRATLQTIGIHKQNIDVDDIVVGFDILEKTLTYVSVHNRTDLAGAELDFYTFLPDTQINGHVAEHELPGMRRLVTHYFAATSGFPTSKVTELTLDADAEPYECHLVTALADDTFKIGPLSLSQVRLDILKRQQGVRGTLTANCMLVGANVPLTSVHEEVPGTSIEQTYDFSEEPYRLAGWRFEGQAERAVTLDELLVDLQSLPDIQFLPSDLDLAVLGAEEVLFKVQGDIAANVLLFICTTTNGQNILIQLNHVMGRGFEAQITLENLLVAENSLPHEEDAEMPEFVAASQDTEISDSDEEIAGSQEPGSPGTIFEDQEGPGWASKRRLDPEDDNEKSTRRQRKSRFEKEKE